MWHIRCQSETDTVMWAKKQHMHKHLEVCQTAQNVYN